jgi:anti-sigma factor RsiW
MKVIALDVDPHAAVQALLPWHAIGQLDSEDAAQVDRHLAACPKCREEFEFERRMLAAQPLPTAVTGDVDRGWASMRKLIRSDQRAQQRPQVLWLRWILGAQFAVIAILFVLIVLPPADTAMYRTLGAPMAGGAADAVVIFRPDATEEQIRLALRASGARIVDGPTASNAYLLSLAGEHPVEAIGRLRAQPSVSLAESLDARPVR